MIRVSATQLRNDLFTYLDQAAAGEMIVIYRNNQEVARLIATPPPDWREQMTMAPQLLVSPAELIKSLDDLWEAHV